MFARLASARSPGNRGRLERRNAKADFQEEAREWLAKGERTMSKCESCGSDKDVAPADVRPAVRAARRKHNLCASCRDRVNHPDAEIILRLGKIVGEELLQKVSQPPTK